MLSTRIIIVVITVHYYGKIPPATSYKHLQIIKIVDLTSSFCSSLLAVAVAGARCFVSGILVVSPGLHDGYLE